MIERQRQRRGERGGPARIIGRTRSAWTPALTWCLGLFLLALSLPAEAAQRGLLIAVSAYDRAPFPKDQQWWPLAPPRLILGPGRVLRRNTRS